MEDHKAEFLAEKTASLAKLVKLALAVCPLASISGGKATWVIYLPKKQFKYLGVFAQEWAEPKFIVAPERNAEEYFGSQEIHIDFRYWCQANPLEVFAAVNSGSELPSRYSQT